MAVFLTSEPSYFTSRAAHRRGLRRAAFPYAHVGRQPPTRGLRCRAPCHRHARWCGHARRRLPARCSRSGVMCGPEPTSVTLFFASKETAVAWVAAAGAEPTLLGFCHVAGSNTRRTVRIRAAIVAASGAREHGYALEVIGAPASINDVFRHANVTARLPSDVAAHAAEHRRRLATGVNYGRCDSNDVAAGNCSDTFSGQTVHLPSALNWQMGSKELSYGDAKVKAEGLHVRITPTVYFELAIRINRIEKFSIAIQGTLDAGAGFSFEADHSVTASNQYDITTVNLPIVSFQIGVFPFVIAPSVPIKAGTFFSANANAKYGATASYSGSVSAGVSMEDGNSLQPKTSITFNQPQSATPEMESSASVQMTAKAWLSAGLNFNVQGLAQLGVRATQTIQAMATIGKFDFIYYQLLLLFDFILFSPIFCSPIYHTCHYYSRAFIVFSVLTP